MTSQSSNPNSTISFAAALTLVGMVVLGLGVRAQAQSDQSASDGLQGSWRVQVTLVNCMTGAPLGPPFTSLLSYARGKHTGEHTFSSVREALIVYTTEPNPPVPGFVKGTQRLTEEIHVDGDQSTHVAIVQFFDVGGNLVRAGCAHAVGQRFK